MDVSGCHSNIWHQVHVGNLLYRIVTSFTKKWMLSLIGPRQLPTQFPTRRGAGDPTYNHTITAMQKSRSLMMKRIDKFFLSEFY
jgi:hypothetical protein